MFQSYTYQVRGRLHVRNGTPGQDRTELVARNGLQALCLADGAGSAKNSGDGASRVVQAGCKILLGSAGKIFDAEEDEIRNTLMTYLLEQLESAAENLNCQMRDLASTFLAVLVSGDKYVALHIGDGVIGIQKNGRVEVISFPDNGEFANETVFVTSARAQESMRVMKGNLDEVTGFILMSDGTAEVLYDERNRKLTPGAAKLIKIVASGSARGKNPEYKKQLKRIMDTVVRERTDDDCSLGILAMKE